MEEQQQEEREKEQQEEERTQLERELLFCLDVLRAAQTAGTAATALPGGAAGAVAARHAGLLTGMVDARGAEETVRAYVARAYRTAMGRARASGAFRAWLAQGAWREVDYQPLMRSQSYDAHGFMQVPRSLPRSRHPRSAASSATSSSATTAVPSLSPSSSKSSASHVSSVGRHHPPLLLAPLGVATETAQKEVHLH